MAAFYMVSTLLAPFTVVIFLCYILALSVYRLFFSPLAKFPGPKLAALTNGYELYYDAVLKGQFTFHMQQLHKKYGPIIRINPDELHVEDPDYYEELYARSEHRDKYEFMSDRFGNPTSVFATVGHDIHRMRRGALNPLFSRRTINDKIVPIVKQKIALMCEGFAQGRAEERIVVLNRAFSAFTGDIITEFAFGKSYNHLQLPDFKEPYHEAFTTMMQLAPIAMQFAWINRLMDSLPEWFVLKSKLPFEAFFQLKSDISKTIEEIMEGKNQNHKDLSHPTVFHTLLESNLPPHEKSKKRLHDDAVMVVGGGLETTSWALSVASFHIINTPAILQKLRAELENAMPDPTNLPDITVLEQLPYLHACTREAVRLSYGVSGRMPRISPHNTMTYGKYTIPPGTPVSMSTVDVHHDESIFPDSHTFKPERWLDNPRAPNGSPLDRYLVAFGKGGRSCLGINLAQAELHIALAAVFRRFKLQLYETDVTDVALAHELFIPFPKMNSQGVRVKVMQDELQTV